MSRLFELVRARDVSGVSGTGVVAEGVEYTDGTIALRWKGEHPATAVWPSLDEVLAVHGHGGATVARFVATSGGGYWPMIIAALEAGQNVTDLRQVNGSITIQAFDVEEWLAWLRVLGGAPDAGVRHKRSTTDYPWEWTWRSPDGVVRCFYIAKDANELDLSEAVTGDADSA